MPLYKRPEEVDEEELEKIDAEPKVVVDKEATWEKRYGDLRSHSQKQVNELTKKINDLEHKLNSPSSVLPRTKEEVEAWAKKYPDVYDLLTTMIQLDVQAVTANLDKRFEDVERDRLENSKERAINAIVAKHSDFYDLEQSTEFHDWLAGKSKRTQDAIYENETDAQAAIEVIDLYKLETGVTKKKPGRPSNRDVATEIRVPSTRTPPSTNSGDYDFSESQIEAMSIREYEKNEEKIEDARRANRIYMDVTGAAR